MISRLKSGNQPQSFYLWLSVFVAFILFLIAGFATQQYFLGVIPLAFGFGLLAERLKGNGIVKNQPDNPISDFKLSPQNELLEKKRDVREVSKQILNLVNDLHQAIISQEISSQQQLSSIAQLNSSISELSATAASIAEVAVQVKEGAKLVRYHNVKMGETIKQAVEQSRLGTESVERTMEASSEVAEFYAELVTLMNELRVKSNNMRKMLDALNAIASETHLLSLNAAIEAAGAGANGERFAIIAQEVRNLSIRSKASSQEAVEIVEQIEGMTVRVTQTAQTGMRKAHTMVELAEQADGIIDQMRLVSDKSYNQAETINMATEEFVEYGDVISSSTHEQLLASKQMVEVVSELQNVARQNSSGNHELEETTLTLHDLTGKLNLIIESLEVLHM